MKLNPDCIRDILLVIEEKSTFSNTITDPDLLEDSRIKNIYSPQEVIYHVRQADLSDLLYGFQLYKIGFSIQDLSPAGHKFINDIRVDTNWNKTKSIAKKVGSYSLDTLKSVSTGVVTNLINQHLNP